MTPQQLEKQSERARREQGFMDGVQGRERRIIGDPIYGQGFRRGNEKRQAGTAHVTDNGELVINR